MGARMSGGGARGPHKLGRRGHGVPAPPGLVAHWCSPQTSSSSQYFSKILEKIILDFQVLPLAAAVLLLAVQRYYRWS